MKILLFGKNGQVGWELNRSLQPLGEVVALDRSEADFSKPEDLRKIIRDILPDVIINAVAYTAVDKAEEEKELAAKINAEAPSVLAEEALVIKALLVHYSTDYVFDGANSHRYSESDDPNPINVYGRTKLDGELAVQSAGCDYLIFRTSWVYASRGHNFLLTILRLAKEKEELSIVADQIGSPTSARLIAETTILCLQQAIREKQLGIFSSNLYHLTTSNSTSWHGFARAIVETANSKLKVNDIKGIPTADYPTPAKRPMNSCLSTTRIRGKYKLILPDWKDSLKLCMEDRYDNL